MKFSIEEIAQLLNGDVVGNESDLIYSLGKIEEADKGCISFLANPKYEQNIYQTKASAVLVHKNFKPKKQLQTALIRVEDPYLSFTALLEKFSGKIDKKGIEQPVFIGNNVTVPESAYMGAFSYIGEGASIGEQVKIYPHCYVGMNVSIGEGSIIYPGVKIYDGSIIGQHCIIHSGVVIGSDGFGFAPQKDHSYRKIPQNGTVTIHDHVEIGANTVIDRATLGTTTINSGVKLDNLIQIAHNVDIGQHTVIAAQSGVSGSTKIGKNCVIAGQVGFVGHIEVADQVKIAAQSGISKSHHNVGTELQGSPAFERKPYLRSYASYRNLPELMERIKQLEEKIVNLSKNEPLK